MEKFDIVIIGGGMAGLSSAVTICSKSELRVALIEKGFIGSNQTTPVVFIETVKEFGLEESILQEYTGFVQHSPLGSCAKFDFKRVVSAGLDYQKACNLLFERAHKKGLILIKAEVKDWLPIVPAIDKPITLRLNNGQDVESKVVIDASGYDQWSAKRLSIKRSKFYSHCFGEYLNRCDIPESYFFRFLGPNRRYGNGGGWLYPIGKDSVSVGYSVNVSEHQYDRKLLMSKYEAAKNEFLPYRNWVSSGERKRVEFGTVPIGRISRFCSDRVLIVGDAAGQAHSWVVEGCRPALRNGRLCAEVAMEAFKNKRFDEKFLSLYERRWNKENRERFWRTESIAEIVWNRSDEEWDGIIRSLSSVPKEKMLFILRDNYASLFFRLYAIAGHIRRSALKFIRENKK